MSQIKFTTNGLGKAPKFILVLDSFDIYIFSELLKEAQIAVFNSDKEDLIDEVKVVVELDCYGIAIKVDNRHDMGGLVIENIKHIADMGLTI